MECAGLCLSTENCYAFYWADSQCKLMSPPGTTFGVSTDQGMMTICRDHQNWNPLEVYHDHTNIPPMCPSKVMRNFIPFYVKLKSNNVFRDFLII